MRRLNDVYNYAEKLGVDSEFVMQFMAFSTAHPYLRKTYHASAVINLIRCGEWQWTYKKYKKENIYKEIGKNIIFFWKVIEMHNVKDKEFKSKTLTPSGLFARIRTLLYMLDNPYIDELNNYLRPSILGRYNYYGAAKLAVLSDVIGFEWRDDFAKIWKDKQGNLLSINEVENIVEKYKKNIRFNPDRVSAYFEDIYHGIAKRNKEVLSFEY